ncbi:MAG TPA: tyrosine-type recombinase/integrase [Terriglobales bacterium]
MDRLNSLSDSGTPAAAVLPLWDVKQAAEYLHRSDSWVRRHLSELPHARKGRSILFDPSDLQRTVSSWKSLEPRKVKAMNRRQRGGADLVGNVWYGTWRLDLPDGSRKPIKFRIGTREEIGFTKQDAYLQLPNKLKEYLAAREEAEEKPESKQQESTSKIDKVPETFLDLVKEWIEVDGPGIRKKSRNTFEHYTEALSAYFGKFNSKKLVDIQRKDVITLLNEQAERYSESVLKTMRTVLRKTLNYAVQNQYIVRPYGWLDKIPLAEAHGRKVVRTELTPEQSLGIIDRLKEPWDTFALLVALLGRRGEEAAALQPHDLDGDHVLHFRRIIYKRRVVELKEHEQIHMPLDPSDYWHAELIRRLRKLGEGKKWVFQSRNGTPMDHTNARKRHLHPAAEAVGVQIGGWHDFRHTLSRTLRRAGVHPVVVRDTLHQSKVDLAMNVYDRATADDIRDGLRVVTKALLGSDLLPRDLLPSAPKQSEGSESAA